MNRNDFRALSALRQKEAKALLDSGHYTGSRYLMGYAVECALKACIAKNTKRYDFPPLNAPKFYSHNLESLFELAGLKGAFDADLAAHRQLNVSWGAVKIWSEQLRYSSVPLTEVQAKDFHTACVARKYGVLTWIRKKW